MMHARRRILWLVLPTLLIVVLGVTFGFVQYQQQKTIRNPLQSDALKGLDFPIYYPYPLPENFIYKPKSARQENGMLFFSIENAGETILISQQPKPRQNLMLESMVGFNPIKTPVGNAFSGKNGAIPVVIIATGQTLINLSGSADVPDYVMAKVIQNLQLIQPSSR